LHESVGEKVAASIKDNLRLTSFVGGCLHLVRFARGFSPRFFASFEKLADFADFADFNGSQISRISQIFNGSQISRVF
ncbi:MAG: hypothetical protein SOR67_05120, partial [Alloprevotella sp.]|nr:hypothetical protein [Alloprevotella sp.]